MTSDDADPMRRLGTAGVVPIVEIDDARHAAPLAEALVAAGLMAIEVTFRTDAAEASLRAIARATPELLLVAGTVLTPDQVDRALDTGAHLLVAPGFSRRVVDRALARDAGILPGVCTPTEVQAVVEAGLSAAKVFPVEPLGGVAWLRALAGPFPAMRWNPTGGIRPETLASYLALPSVLACGGSWVAPRADIAARRWDAIADRARQAAELVRLARGAAS